MKRTTNLAEPLFDPILAEVYRIRDAYALKFKFDTEAICDALASSRFRHPSRKTDRAGKSARRRMA